MRQYSMLTSAKFITINSTKCTHRVQSAHKYGIKNVYTQHTTITWTYYNSINTSMEQVVEHIHIHTPAPSKRTNAQHNKKFTLQFRLIQLMDAKLIQTMLSWLTLSFIYRYFISSFPLFHSSLFVIVVSLQFIFVFLL